MATAIYPRDFHPEPAAVYRVDASRICRGSHTGATAGDVVTGSFAMKCPDLSKAVQEAIQQGGSDTVGLSNVRIEATYVPALFGGFPGLSVEGNPIVRQPAY